MSSEIRIGTTDNFRSHSFQTGGVTGPSVVSETSATGYNAVDLADQDLSKIWLSDTTTVGKKTIIFAMNGMAAFGDRDYISIVDPTYSDYPALSGGGCTKVEFFDGTSASPPSWDSIGSISGTELYQPLWRGRALTVKYAATQTVADRVAAGYTHLKVEWTVSAATIQVGCSKLIMGDALTGSDLGFRISDGFGLDYENRNFKNRLESGATAEYRRKSKRYVSGLYKYVDSTNPILWFNNGLYVGDENYVVLFLDWNSELATYGIHEHTIPARLDSSVKFTMRAQFGAGTNLGADVPLVFEEWL